MARCSSMAIISNALHSLRLLLVVKYIIYAKSSLKAKLALDRIVLSNRPFPSFSLPHFQNEYPCETIQIKMSLICMKMNVQVKHIFI